MEINAMTAAKRITQLAAEDNIGDLSPLKLQKLLYFVEGGLLADDDVATFFPETPEAWRYGPVYVDVYEKFKTKRYGEQIVETDFEGDLNTQFDQEIEKSLKATWERYKNTTAGDLVTKTHRTEPWITAKNFGYGSRISKEDMREYFTKTAHEQAATT